MMCMRNLLSNSFLGENEEISKILSSPGSGGRGEVVLKSTQWYITRTVGGAKTPNIMIYFILSSISIYSVLAPFLCL